MSIRLYSWNPSSAPGARWALEELGVPYEYIQLDRAKNEHRAPAYLAINPNGKVPALVDSGQPYFESLAIMLHLGESYGQKRGLWPSDGAGRAERAVLVGVGDTELRAYMMQYLYHGLDTPVSYAPADRSNATAEYNHRQYQWMLDVLETRLAGRPYILGDTFSLADIPAAAVLMFGTMLGAGVEGRAHVEAWLSRCSARPALAKGAD